MTITKEITKDKTKLSQRINKSVVDFIKASNKAGEPQFSTKMLINYVYNQIGYKDEILADESVRNTVNGHIVKLLDMLETVNAISTNSNLVNAFSTFIEKKKSGSKVRELSIDKPNTYSVSAHFNKKINLLKTNELILNSGAAIFYTGENDVKVIIAKDAKLNYVKECNKIFHYENIGHYIGCMDETTNRVDLVATNVEPKKFFETKKARTFPVKKEIENLYYLINFSEEYKQMFQPKQGSEQAVVSSFKIKQKPELMQIISTDNLIAKNA